jgi:hypothetical protein
MEDAVVSAAEIREGTPSLKGSVFAISRLDGSDWIYLAECLCS